MSSTGTSNNKPEKVRGGVNFYVFFWSFVSLLRIAIGFHPHSGQDNHHGSANKGAYGGDFEAQRHWMELTLHLPIGDWYHYDLNYWGLDYPPLTAYVSWICGMASHYVVGPESVAFETSRGIENPTHKAFMRATVLVLDLLVYGNAVWFAIRNRDRKSLWTIMIALCQPAILLIDHGHFQYNTVALGLSIVSLSFIVKENFSACVWGGFFFSLALNFKQMTLYYAPVVFFYLLGRCLSKPRLFMPRIAWLGGIVLFTFYVLWEPFVKYAPSDNMTLPPLQRLEHVVRRIFPLQRGLFEGKVANLWCALNTSPFNIRNRVAINAQPLVALVVTCTLMAPSCYKVFCLGLSEPSSMDGTKRHWVVLLLATTSCALSFFLASFQVHEKSILLPLAPCTLLFWQDPAYIEWFSFVCVWSLWPLLQVDRLQVAYCCIITIFASLVWFRRIGMSETKALQIFSGKLSLLRAIPNLSYIGMICLHVTQALIPAPERLPDLYEVLWSVTGCGLFLFAWFVTTFELFFSSSLVPSQRIKEKAD